MIPPETKSLTPVSTSENITSDHMTEPRLGAVVRRLRKGREMTQVHLAKRVHVSQGFISRLEHSTISPSLRTLKKLARALGVPVGELVE